MLFANSFIRKCFEDEDAISEADLKEENADLRKKIEDLERLVEDMKEKLNVNVKNTEDTQEDASAIQETNG